MVAYDQHFIVIPMVLGQKYKTSPQIDVNVLYLTKNKLKTILLKNNIYNNFHILLVFL